MISGAILRWICHGKLIFLRLFDTLSRLFLCRGPNSHFSTQQESIKESTSISKHSSTLIYSRNDSERIPIRSMYFITRGNTVNFESQYINNTDLFCSVKRSVSDVTACEFCDAIPNRLRFCKENNFKICS